MSDHTDETAPRSTPFWKGTQSSALITSAAIVSAGLMIGGFLLGDGLLRAKAADRAVTVRGLAERNVMADLATWTLSFSSTAASLQSAQAGVDRDSTSIKTFFHDLGFPANAIEPNGISVNYFTNKEGLGQYTVRQRISLRTHDIARAQKAVRQQIELVRRGVVLQDGSGMSYSFTKLDTIKPAMVAAATKDARAAAEQFARDSGAEVGKIRSATQGYFSIEARDGDTGGWGANDTPFKKVRVVTTVAFSLD